MERRHERIRPKPQPQTLLGPPVFIYGLLGLLVLVIALAFASATAESKTLQTEQLVLKTGGGDHKFTVEIAESASEQAVGLMFRTSMAADRGMLFIYDKQQPVAMWMKNTYISLDMVFITEKGVVHHVVHNTVPQSLKTIESNGKVLAVLELNAGTADRIGLKPGDTVVHKTFTQ